MGSQIILFFGNNWSWTKKQGFFLGKARKEQIKSKKKYLFLTASFFQTQLSHTVPVGGGGRKIEKTNSTSLDRF